MKRRVKGADVRLAIGVVVGLFVAGVVLPLASPERSVQSELGISTVGGGAAGAETFAAPGASDDGRPSASAAPGAPGSTDASGAVRGPAGTASGTPDQPGDAAAPGAGQPGADPETSGGADVERTASDRGVTADAITIGVALADLDTLNRTGVGASNGTVDERRKVWEAIVDDANRRGGVGGRTIEAVFAPYDAIDRTAAAQACRRLAEDSEVFVMFGDVGWNRPAATCATRQYGVPNISYDPLDVATFADSGGLLWTSLATAERILQNHVTSLHDRGLLRGKTLGLVTTEGDTDAYDTVEIPTLRSLGYEVAHRSDLSQDPSTAQSQIPVEIQQMRSKGVDFIIWEGGPLYGNFWIPSAQRSGYRPSYSFSEWNSGSDDFSIQAVTDQIDAYAWSSRRKIERRTDRPAADTDAACVALASEATGIDMPRDRDLYWETARYCGHLAAFVDAAVAAGPNPTRQRFAAAFSNLGRRPAYDVGPAGVGGSFAPGKPDAADHVHMMRHSIECRCWRPEGDWLAMKPLAR